MVDEGGEAAAWIAGVCGLIVDEVTDIVRPVGVASFVNYSEEFSVCLCQNAP